MKIVINGKEKEVSILYGRKAIFNYAGVVKLAGMRAKTKPTVTYKAGELTGSLTASCSGVKIGTDVVPIFNVINTNNA